MLIPFALLALFSGQEPKKGDQFLALPGTPPMFSSDRKLFPAAKLMLHKLTFQKLTADGTSRFLLDGKIRLHARDPGLYEAGALRPLVETIELHRLRKTYVGRRLWCYGGRTLFKEIDHPRATGRIQVEYDQPVQIERIFQLGNVRCNFSQSGQWGGLGPTLLMSYDPQKDGPGSAFVVVYKTPRHADFGAGGDTRWTVSERARTLKETNFSAPYNAFMGAWFFDRVFSIKPPPAKVKAAVTKVNASALPVEESTLGLTHEQLAWAFGWPMQRISTAALLKAEKWTDHDYYWIEFKGDKVVSFNRSMPH